MNNNYSETVENCVTGKYQIMYRIHFMKNRPEVFSSTFNQNDQCITRVVSCPRGKNVAGKRRTSSCVLEPRGARFNFANV